LGSQKKRETLASGPGALDRVEGNRRIDRKGVRKIDRLRRKIRDYGSAPRGKETRQVEKGDRGLKVD